MNTGVCGMIGLPLKLPQDGKKQPGNRRGVPVAKFTFTPLNVPDVILVQPTAFGDARGYFMETWRQDAFEAAGIAARWVQDNQSASARAFSVPNQPNSSMR